MIKSVVVNLDKSHQTSFPIEDYRLSVKTIDGNAFRFTPKIVKTENAWSTPLFISFYGLPVASKLNDFEWQIDEEVKSITALWRLDEYKIIPKGFDVVPCAGVIGNELYEIHQSDIFSGEYINIVNSKGHYTLKKDNFDELLVLKNNYLFTEDGFYRNGDGSIIVNVSNEGFCCLNVENGKQLSLDEMSKNGPWTKVAFVDVKS